MPFVLLMLMRSNGQNAHFHWQCLQFKSICFFLIGKFIPSWPMTKDLQSPLWIFSCKASERHLWSFHGDKQKCKRHNAETRTDLECCCKTHRTSRCGSSLPTCDFSRDFNIRLLVSKAVNGLAPVYIAELSLLYEPDLCLRSSSITPCDQAFAACVPQLWNSLPGDLRQNPLLQVTAIA